MPSHNLIVIGTSAGGLEALRTIVRALPRDFPASVFVVQHLMPTGSSFLPDILSSAGNLTAQQATDGMAIEAGCIYIAPPDHHMLIGHRHIHVVRGPKENGFRPAIDATMRTAARVYGVQVVGVILSGMLDDGTAGLLAIRRRGGIAIAQEPTEAPYPSMPISALRYVSLDAVLSAAEIGPMLVRLAHTQIDPEREGQMTDNEELEAAISEMNPTALNESDQHSEPTPFSCPDCGGVLAEYFDGELPRFRCQVGHVYSPQSLFASQTTALDQQLWAAFRALDERVVLAQRLTREATRLKDQVSIRRFRQLAEQAELQKQQLRAAMIDASDNEAD